MRSARSCLIGLKLLFLIAACGLLPVDESTATPDPHFNSIESIEPPVLRDKLYDPYDSTQPAWLIATDSGYQLKPDLGVTRIEYVYKWWGLSPTPDFDWQKIEHRDGKYWSDSLEIPEPDLRAFLDALGHLLPTQSAVEHIGHTDDYPSRQIEITGSDGQHLLLFSSSNDEGGVPWNVLYNGRLYAQYDGTLIPHLARLFPSAGGMPATTFIPGNRSKAIVYNTTGWPPQLSYGFWGLLPVADDFSYFANAISGKLEGHIVGRSSIGGYDNMVIGQIATLNSVALTLLDGSTLPCPTTATPDENDPASASWKFECLLSEHTGPYRYPAHIEFGTVAGKTFVTTGELWGRWQAQTPMALLLPLPDELQQALNASEVARDLMRDHVPLALEYYAEIGWEGNPLTGTLSGDLTLLGETEFEGTVWPYALQTPFTVRDGQLERWEIDRANLVEFLTDVNRQPITRRVRQAIPQTKLTLWYAEEAGGGPFFNVTLARCAGLPGEGDYPRREVPLRAFTFHDWRPQFLLIDGKAVVSDLDFWPNNASVGAPLILLPKEFDTGAALPFSRVWLNRNTYHSSNNPPELTLWLNRDTSEETPIKPEDLEVYTRLANALPQPVNKEYSTLWEAENLTFDIQDDGQLKVVACGDKP